MRSARQVLASQSAAQKIVGEPFQRVFGGGECPQLSRGHLHSIVAFRQSCVSIDVFNVAVSTQKGVIQKDVQSASSQRTQTVIMRVLRFQKADTLSSCINSTPAKPQKKMQTPEHRKSSAELAQTKLAQHLIHLFEHISGWCLAQLAANLLGNDQSQIRHELRIWSHDDPWKGNSYRGQFVKRFGNGFKVSRQPSATRLQTRETSRETSADAA